MTTEKDIRQFVKSNAPMMSGDEDFMSELKRRIDLLPVPASLAGRGEEKMHTAIAAMKKTVSFMKRKNRTTAIGISVVAVLLLVAASCVLYGVSCPAVAVPDAGNLISRFTDFMKGNGLYITIAFSAAVFTAALAGARRAGI